MIPATAHFIWFGEKLPFLYMAGIRSAAVKGGFGRVVLHGEAGLESTPYWGYLQETPGFEFRVISPSIFSALPVDGSQQLQTLFESLTAPAARANMLRAAVLYREGGVYLDTDTVAVGSFEPMLRAGGFFCGEERIVFPGGAEKPVGLRAWAKALTLLGLRDAMRRTPRGWKAFRGIESQYALAANNAVMGAEAAHPFVKALLVGMVETPLERQHVRFALGTHLLQQTLEGWNEGGVQVYPPRYFFPIAPEVSQHWFLSGTGRSVGEMLQPDTVLVHWYASVRTKEIVPRLSPEEIAAKRHDVALYRLVSQFL